MINLFPEKPAIKPDTRYIHLKTGNLYRVVTLTKIKLLGLFWVQGVLYADTHGYVFVRHPFNFLRKFKPCEN